MMPRPGDRVLYTLDSEDADGVNARRDNFQRHQAETSHGKHPHTRGGSGASGHIAHIGLRVREGFVLPADVVQVSPYGDLSLRVLLPGSDIQWVINVPEGTGPGTWQARET
jgi:hypothetical protein